MGRDDNDIIALHGASSSIEPQQKPQTAGFKHSIWRWLFSEENLKYSLRNGMVILYHK